jgi:hypothetical protein
VGRLSEHDASAMLGFVSELNDFDDVLPFPPRLLARLQELIASDAVGYSELDPVRERSILQVQHWPAGGERIVCLRGRRSAPTRDRPPHRAKRDVYRRLQRANSFGIGTVRLTV